jgi:hypothetical protein
VLAGLIGITVYAATNPYVVLHLLHGGEALRANFDNTRDMYRATLSGSGLRCATEHALAALSVPLATAFMIAAIIWVVRPKRLSPLAILLLAPALCVVVQFVLFAEGKPGEYGRFFIFPAAVAVVAVGWLIARLSRPFAIAAGGLALAVVTGWFATQPYLQAFANDATGKGTREAVGQWLAHEAPRGAEVVEIRAEPAPYAVPAIDLWRWRLLLTRGPAKPTGDIVIRAVDTLPKEEPPPGYRRLLFDGDHPPAPIAWADKPFEVLIRGQR